MGHVRLGILPTSRKWQQVVALLEEGTSTDQIAAAAADAAEHALDSAVDDPIFREAVWLLTNLPLVARAPDYVEGLKALGLPIDRAPSLFDLSASIAAALDAKSQEAAGRTDLGEMAQLALVESLTAAVEPHLPSLFEAKPEDVRHTLGRLAGGDGFASLARSFFARLTHRCLDYFLSRELANHIGAHRRFSSDAERRSFDAALSVHCRETSKIVEDFAGGWYGKTVWQQDRLDREAVDRFARYAFKKMRTELTRRRDAG